MSTSSNVPLVESYKTLQEKVYLKFGAKDTGNPGPYASWISKHKWECCHLETPSDLQYLLDMNKEQFIAHLKKGCRPAPHLTRKFEPIQVDTGNAANAVRFPTSVDGNGNNRQSSSSSLPSSSTVLE